MKVSIISGTSITRSRVFEAWGIKRVVTPYGPVEYKQDRGIVVVNRHGFTDPRPPHNSNYRGYVYALKLLGIDTVIALSSVGSLSEGLPPGTLVSCSDYVSFAPVTFLDDVPSGFAPSIDNRLLDNLKEISPHPIESGKIYAQTRGPRFETRAEVQILKKWGCDVVGMTFANESDLLLESQISVTSLCMVDNFANGIGEQGLSMASFQESVLINQQIIDEVLSATVTRFGK